MDKILTDYVDQAIETARLGRNGVHSTRDRVLVEVRMKANGDAIICDIGASRTTELKLVNVKQRTRARHYRTSNSAQLLPNQEKQKMQMSIRQPKYKPVDEPNDCIYWSKQDLKKIINEYEVLVRRFLDVGWDGYIVTVDFNELRGAEETQVTQMRQAMGKLYTALSKSLVGAIRPKDKSAGYLPIGVFFPHLSRSKFYQAEEAGMNTGSASHELHMRGIVIANRWRKMRAVLNEHFAKNKRDYLRGQILDIHVERFDQHGGSDSRAVGYLLDGLLTRTFIPDDILILNWGSKLKPSAWPGLDCCSGSEVP